MGQGLSLSARRKIIRGSAVDYARAAKKDKGRILDDLLAVTGWSRANAYELLTSAEPAAPGMHVVHTLFLPILMPDPEK
jgi:hypothetical protein